MQGYQRLAFWRAAGPLLARPRPPRAPSKFEALPRGPRLHLFDQRLDLSAEQVQANIFGEGATGGTGSWHPLRLDAELEVKLDELALHAKSSTWTPLPLGRRFPPPKGFFTATGHDRVRRADRYAIGKRKTTMRTRTLALIFVLVAAAGCH